MWDYQQLVLLARRICWSGTWDGSFNWTAPTWCWQKHYLPFCVFPLIPVTLVGIAAGHLLVMSSPYPCVLKIAVGLGLPPSSFPFSASPIISLIQASLLMGNISQGQRGMWYREIGVFAAVSLPCVLMRQ